jgi:nitrogen fixation/metabolism regulation signal transduction histidine kinase
MKVLIVISVAAATTLLFLLISASANTGLFARHYQLLLGVNIAAAAALMLLVTIQLGQFWREYRRGVFGSKLKSRLLWMLALMAILPGALLYGVSMQFATSSIESWFDVRVDSALDAGLNLGRSVLAARQADLADKARTIAIEIGGNEGTSPNPGRLYRIHTELGVQSATLLTGTGKVILSSSNVIDDLAPSLPAAAQLRRAREERGLTWVDGDAQSGMTLHALQPVTNGNLVSDMLLLSQRVPEDIARNAAVVESAYRDYQELQLGKTGLKRIYTMTLTLTLLLSLFAAVALAFFLSRRLAEPLLILIEGTRAVAAGDFKPLAALESRDELGVLTQSFNFMTQRLHDAQGEAERHRTALESARGYLESVLANLSAGVMAFNKDFVLRASNRGAAAILGDDLTSYSDVRLDQWPDFTALTRAILNGFREQGVEWQREIELSRPGVAPKTLLVRGSTLPGGYVVVFDDITELIAAQRSAAWGEVARRLAHEIKNPLTPIQLSAERLQIKLSNKLDPESREILERSTQTIINQVESMKNMVNDFRDYARTPPPLLVGIDLNALIEELLGLYESSRARVVTALDPDLPAIRADANQFRQVLHNLLANAEDALVDTTSPSIRIATKHLARRVVLSLCDNGPGFAPNTLARAFEPYVTTKARGTGLGLAIVKKIVDEHHGDIRLTNLASGGAEITIKLPLAEPLPVEP